MATKNIVIFIHGMVTTRVPTDHTARYNGFFQRLAQHTPNLGSAFDDQIKVEWGHELLGPQPPLRDDQRIMGAENRVYDHVNYRDVKATSGPNNQVINDWSWLFFLRGIFRSIKEETLIFGLADVSYYGSADGEKAVREAIYGQVLDKLANHEQDDVHLHVVAASLGCAVAFDFLYGLFAPASNWAAGVPDFAADPSHGPAFMHWRTKRENGGLHLASMCSMASQIPLLLLRKQQVVNTLHAGQVLDPNVVGMSPGDPTKWKIFYDIDDILAFPTRNLFGDHSAIMDIQVDTADRPDTAHDRYWVNHRVIGETADLLTANLA